MPHSNAQRSMTGRTPGYLPGEERRIHLVRKLGPVAPEALAQTRGAATAMSSVKQPRLLVNEALPLRRSALAGPQEQAWGRAKAYMRSIGFSFAWHLPKF